MHYDQTAVDQEFRTLAMLADAKVHELARGPQSERSADEHDEALGDYSVYRFLHARPFLLTRQAVLSELRWFQDIATQVPENAYSAARFTSSQYSLVAQLIRRFTREPSAARTA